MEERISQLSNGGRPELLFTTEELATLLKVHIRTIPRLCKSGHLPMPIKIGGVNRWRVKEIEEVLS